MVECGLATNDSDSKQRASQLIIAAVDRARAAILKYNENVRADNRKKMIAGCVPPLTECYFSSKVPLSIDCLIPEYTVILSTLLECNVDLLLAETLSTHREAQAILRSLNCIHQTGRHRIPPLWLSFTVHDDRPSKLRSDEPLDMVCQSILREATILNLPLEAVGINCSAPSAISYAVPILAKLVEGTAIKVCAYGNCFKTSTSEWIQTRNDNANDRNSECTAEQRTEVEICAKDYDEEGLTPDAYAAAAIEWARSGARIIGGCCGSRPKHMSKVAIALKDFVEMEADR
jgi:S-methylmethionine-dependent homocysteine/selenocysteine methylase